MGKVKKIFYIMRGMPSSGKSFTAKKMLEEMGGDPNEHIFSADNYFIPKTLDLKKQGKEVSTEDECNEYRNNWHYSKLGKAHDLCFHGFKNAIEKGISPIILDNTNIKAKDIKRYAVVAKKAGYQIIIKEPDSPWWQDHRHMLEDKQKYGTKLENFARFLAGFHQGMEKKYGVKGNKHGVPLDTIRSMIRKWEPNMTVDDILGGN